MRVATAVIEDGRPTREGLDEALRQRSTTGDGLHVAWCAVDRVVFVEVGDTRERLFVKMQDACRRGGSGGVSLDPRVFGISATGRHW